MSSPLSQQRCAPCKSKGGSPAALSSDVVQTQMAAELCHSWTLADNGSKICRQFTCRNFGAALAWINAAGAVAEDQGHHPDLHLTSYRVVKVVVYTHSVGGLCLNDLILAAHLDQLPCDYSPKFLKENPGVTAGRLAGEGEAKH